MPDEAALAVREQLVAGSKGEGKVSAGLVGLRPGRLPSQVRPLPLSIRVSRAQPHDAPGR